MLLNVIEFINQRFNDLYLYNTQYIRDIHNNLYMFRYENLEWKGKYNVYQ